MKELPIVALMAFTLVYTTIGNPNSELWSALYFIANYLTMFFLFKNYRHKEIRLIGMSLSVSILFFIVSKYFTNFDVERYYTIIPFTICLFGLYKLEKI